MRQLVGVIKIEWLAWAIRLTRSVARARRLGGRRGAKPCAWLSARRSVIRQLAMLKAEGCWRIFKENLSRRDGVRRPQIDKVIEALGEGRRPGACRVGRVTRSNSTASHSWVHEGNV